MKLHLGTILIALTLPAFHTHAREGDFITPTVEVSASQITYEDDLNFELLDLAIQRQLDAFDAGVDLKGRVRFGEAWYPKAILRDSLVLFQELGRGARECLSEKKRGECFERFNRSVHTRFRVYRPTIKATRFTAYYSPDFEGALTPSERFRVPLYRTPEDPALKESSRESIIYEGALAGRGLESVYLDADLFELYSLQIEGGGRVRVDLGDGVRVMKHISFDGMNAQPLRFFSKLMVERGYLDPTETSYDKQRSYFLEHPEIQRELFRASPSYVYFKLTDEEPVGIHGIPLTERRSLAFDRRHYPASGLLNFIKVNVNGKEVTRFMLSQDTGGAIKGPARADLYFGYGAEARTAAESLGGYGSQYFLIKKK
jgi:membrane-bound lytic murein transglycosylase A